MHDDLVKTFLMPSLCWFSAASKCWPTVTNLTFLQFSSRLLHSQQEARFIPLGIYVSLLFIQLLPRVAITQRFFIFAPRQLNLAN